MAHLVDHSIYMQCAIELAKSNPAAPFAAVLVNQRKGAIVAKGVNQTSANPLMHGEIAAIEDYVRQGGDDWEGLTLYTTAEPCCMCQGAILWAGIRNVVFGASIVDLHRLGWRQIAIPAAEVAARSWESDYLVQGGICADRCLELFAVARHEAPSWE